MIQSTIRDIKKRIEREGRLSEQERLDLLKLLDTLKHEVDELARTRAEDAESISRFIAASTHEATRSEPNPRLLKLSIDALASSAEGFESSHPRMVDSVNSVCVMLSNIGI